MDTTSATESSAQPQHRGFAAVPNWLVMDADVSAHEKLVYLVLSSMIGAQGCWFTEHKAIARAAGISESSVQRALKALRDRNVVTWRPRFHPDNPKIRLGNEYRIMVDTLGLSDWGVVSEGHQGGVSVTEKKKNPEEEHTPPTPSAEDADFEALWKAWPKKVKREDALRAWRKLSTSVKNEAIPHLVAHANAYRQHTPPQFIPGLAPFLNGKRWHEDLAVSRDRGAYKPEPKPAQGMVIPQGHVPVRNELGQIIGSRPA